MNAEQIEKELAKFLAEVLDKRFIKQGKEIYRTTKKVKKAKTYEGKSKALTELTEHLLGITKLIEGYEAFDYLETRTEINKDFVQQSLEKKLYCVE